MTTQDDPQRLVDTKLFVPSVRQGLVARPRLVERLRHGSGSKLTLISAPAGFGKTTLLAQWLEATADEARTTAWLSLDAGDNQAGAFWPYLIGALQRAAPGVGMTALSLLREAQPASLETVLAILLNDLSERPNEIVLVLDDYHVIDAQEIHDGLAYLLEHLPPQVHIAILTRADPSLPLARWRGRAELAELRTADLRFTADEAGAYLNEVMGLDLGSADVGTLEGRTEGWIAALQLAALSIRGREDVAGFIARFAGDHRYIVDYLVEEVLQRQPDPVRTFLSETCILDRLCGPLCDGVTGGRGGRAMLEALDRGNLFLVPLDDRRQWYRYHQLFADVLQARLMDEQPDHVPLLHRRASGWYERNGEPSEAIRHAIAGGDFERAADLVEAAIPAARRGRREAVMRGWLEALPAESIAARPVLSVHYAGALLVGGELEGVEAHLRDAERWLDAAAETTDGPNPSSMVVVDEDGFRRLPSAIAIYRAAQARALGDEAGTVAHARRAFDLAGDEDHLERGGAAGFLALASWTRGDLDAAHGYWAAAQASLERAGHLSDALGCARALADIRIAQGRLHEAKRTYDRGLTLATEQGGPVVRGVADMHVGLSRLDLEWDDVDGATRHLLTSQELGEHAGLGQNRYRWGVAMAGVREAGGDLDGALRLLDEAERAYVDEYFPDVRPIAALRARLWIRQRRFAEGWAWARAIGLSAEDPLTYLREYGHVTLARLLLAQGRHSQDADSIRRAADLLERLLGAAEDSGRIHSVIEILVLRALAHQANGDVPAGLVSLERALELAEPEGYVRLFIGEGRPMTALLEAAPRRGSVADQIRRVRATSAQASDGVRVRQALVEPLSERELDVLRLLGTDLSGPEIARELVVSLSTIRSHTKAIYAKLGVNDRRAAVRRGEELGLLARRDDRPQARAIGDR